MNSDTKYNLERFVSAQEPIYDAVVAELSGGQKHSHWMWFIFPQITGLGFSETARFYAIKDEYEAREYLQHPVLGARLKHCTQLVLNIEGRSLAHIFGYPDDRKFKSCMTLFATVSNSGSLFEQALERYCDAEQDSKTLNILILQRQSSDQ